MVGLITGVLEFVIDDSEASIGEGIGFTVEEGGLVHMQGVHMVELQVCGVLGGR